MRPAAELALLVAALAASCTPPAPAPVSYTWPAGTVLAVEGVPITAEEVDLASVYVERIHPGSSPAQLRRLALTNVALPRAVSRVLAPELYARARESALATLATVKAGQPLVGPPSDGLEVSQRITGGWSELGLLAWGIAMDLPEGEWSEPIEEVGHFILLRRVAHKDGPVPIATQVTVDAFVFPWLASDRVQREVDAAYDHCKLTIVDPEWRAIVPEHTQYRMGVHKP